MMTIFKVWKVWTLVCIEYWITPDKEHFYWVPRSWGDWWWFAKSLPLSVLSALEVLWWLCVMGGLVLIKAMQAKILIMHAMLAFWRFEALFI